LPANGTITFVIVATNTLVNGFVTNTAALILPPGLVDASTANNTATDVNTVLAAANLTITKTDGTTTVLAGATTNYTLTVSNAGPSPADGATLRDPAATGLVCTDVVCSAATGMSCPALAGTAAGRVAGLQTGLVLNPFPAYASLTFTVSCGVTATGQ
jgi:uncharacterized repeat protein (TIGR01451 family)